MVPQLISNDEESDHQDQTQLGSHNPILLPAYVNNLIKGLPHPASGEGFSKGGPFKRPLSAPSSPLSSNAPTQRLVKAA